MKNWFVHTPAEAKPPPVLYTVHIMPRTRDALIAVVAFMCISIGAGFVVTSRGEEVKSTVREDTTQEVVFLTPQEEYKVAPYVDDAFRDTRDSFIEKVRNTYPKEEIIEEPAVTILTPVIETVPSVTASTTYGDTRL